MKTFLAIVLMITSLSSFAQDTTTTKKVYHNEFGIDATSFVKAFIPFGSLQINPYYSPSYFLTYRRHLKSGNIRFAIAGDYSYEQIKTTDIPDLHEYFSKSYSYEIRLGWEFCEELSKRWQVFYGIDLLNIYSAKKNDADYINYAYAFGINQISRIKGVSPLLGFRFKLTNRLALSTEVSISINYLDNSSSNYYIPRSVLFPAVPEEINPRRNLIYTSFRQPLFVFLTFDI